MKRLLPLFFLAFSFNLYAEVFPCFTGTTLYSRTIRISLCTCNDVMLNLLFKDEFFDAGGILGFSLRGEHLIFQALKNFGAGRGVENTGVKAELVVAGSFQLTSKK
jgi:hypothetical protein